MGVIDIVNSPSVHLLPVATDALVMFKMAANNAGPRTTERKSCKVMSLLSGPFTVLIAIAMGNLGETFNSAARTRQSSNPLVVGQLDCLRNLRVNFQPLWLLLGSLERIPRQQTRHAAGHR